MRLAGTRCLVTGAASGIGRATARRLVAEHARVVLTDVNADGLREVERELGDAVLHAEAFDITDREAVQRLKESVDGALDVVMNIAGVSTWGPVGVLGPEDWRRNVEINLMGPIHVIDAFVPPMVEARRGGHVVNVASAAALLGLPWHAAYSAGKFGLRGVSEVLRFDLKRHGIGVSLVCPGAVDTGLVQTVDLVGVDREHPLIKKMTARFQKRAIPPEKVADAIVKGVERNRYLVYTSPDIRAAHLLQRYVPPAYERIMLRLNDHMVSVAEKAPPRSASGAPS
jgi:NAD(P)-dependent dehydrogenase (short-subunit alcohol dehydrogenase family)